MKKLIYSLLIVTATICSMSACSSDEPYAEIDQRSKQIATRSTELEISDVVRNLNQSFGNTMTKSLETVYPDYYGGVYVNENGELVILVTEGSDNAYQKDLSQRCRSNNFITKQCKYSYNELFNIIKRLEAFQTNGANKEKMSSLKFYGFSLADNLNAICIQLGDISEENIAKFKSEVMDFPGIIFEKSAPISFEAFVNAGQDILGAIVSGQGSAGSVGFRAKRNSPAGVPLSGIVISGHVIKSVGNPVYLGSTTTNIIAECQAMQFSGDVDAAFCFNKNGYEGSNHINNSFLDLVPQTAELYIGATVYMNGRNTTSSGMITSTYASITVNGITLSNIIQANYLSQGGDSGAIVYNESLQIAGIHDAGPTGGGAGYRYFISGKRIVSALGLTLY